MEMETENRYIETDLGNVAPNPRGDYSAETTYEYLDLVVYKGGSYLCVADTSQGTAPEPGKTTAVWQVLTLPGDLTPEYVAIHDDVVNKAASAAEDAAGTAADRVVVADMKDDVERLQREVTESTASAKADKESAAGYAAAAEASRRATAEAEANVVAQVTGFDEHVTEKTEEAATTITDERTRAIQAVDSATQAAKSAASSAADSASIATQAASTATSLAAAAEAASKTATSAASETVKTAKAAQEDIATAKSNAIKAVQDAAAEEKKAAAASASAAAASAENAKASETSAGAMLGKVTEEGEKQIADIRGVLNDVTNGLRTVDEKAIETYYALRRTGKVYQTKVWLYAKNPTSAGEKLLDNADLVCEPSTDTVQGRDDYASIPLFEWVNCNYIRDDDGAPRPIAIEGMQNYKTSGAFDVGTMQMSFYWKVETNAEEGYQLWTISDSPHEELGLSPWSECVKADGTVLPWCIGSKYFSGVASDGLPRSQPGLAIINFVSHNSIIKEYAKKGTGYQGGGAERNTFQILFNIIKGNTKSSQTLYAGCTNYSQQYKVSAAETDVERVLVSNAQASQLVVGSAVSIGDPESATNLDRGNAYMRNIADKVRITSIEDLGDGTSAVNVDNGGAKFTTTDTTYISTMPWHSGATDSVLGHHDGSPVSNTSGKFPYRVQGREYAVGAYCIASDTVMFFREDYSKDVYVATKDTKHSSSDATIKSTYKLIGNIPAHPDGKGSDYWIGDVNVDLQTGGWNPASQGSGSSQGMGDILYAGGANASGSREYLQGGNLGGGSDGGSAFLDCWGWLDWASWGCAGCD